MLYGISTRSTCCCTATACTCFSQGGTQATTVVSETCPTHISSNQIVWVIASAHEEREEPRIVWVVRPRVPPPRYRRTGLQADSRKHRPVASGVRRAGRERGHAFGHSPRNQSRH
jgi:hypothetical protein